MSKALFDRAWAAAKAGNTDFGSALKAAWGIYKRGGYKGKGNTIMDAVGQAVVLSIQEELRSMGLKDSRIINLVDYAISANGRTLEILLPDYYIYIEKGRRPGATPPPLGPLIQWMKQRRIAPGREGRIVWAIRTAIARRGIRARPFLKRALETSEQEAYAIMGASFEGLLDRALLEAIA